jgi:hypothetical protein
MNQRKLLLLLSSLTIMLTVLMVGCKEEDPVGISQQLVKDYDAEAALEWNKLFLSVERYAEGYRPGPAPRALGLMGLAAYEASITGMPSYNSLESRFPGLTIPNVEPNADYHWPTVVHSVYSTMMPSVFDWNISKGNIPAGVLSEWQALENTLNQKYQSEAGEAVFNRSKAYGESVGLAVWEWSTTDPYGYRAHENPFGNPATNETYWWDQHYDSPGDWEPHTPGPTSPMGPFFGKARTFALKESEKLSLPPSAYFMEYSENVHSEYYSQALQTYTKNAATDYQVEWIGEFWSDDLVGLTFSPGPRWVAIANQVIEDEDVELERALEAYAKVGMALNDAAVGCWNSKFYYNVERPVTYIHKFIDPDYKPNLDNPITGDVGFTPPFPAYPSGHSTMGGAGAEALASVFGYAHSMTDNCHLGRTEFEGTPRTYGSFYEMAVENSVSRILLGVHWKMDCEEGVRYGTTIGRKVNALPWRK